MDGPRLAQRRADCTVVELDDRVSIFNPDTQTVHTLSASATAVWHQLSGRDDLEAVTRAVARSFAVPVEQVRADVAAVVETLTEAGVVTVEGRPW